MTWKKKCLTQYEKKVIRRFYGHSLHVLYIIKCVYIKDCCLNILCSNQMYVYIHTHMQIYEHISYIFNRRESNEYISLLISCFMKLKYSLN